jgi:hypothetical protein
MLCILRRSGPIDRIGALALVFLLRMDGQSFAPAGTAEVIELHGNGNRLPIWTGGVLVSIENNNTGTPIIHAFDETGQENLPIAFSIPGAQTVQIAGVSRESDGASAVAGWTIDREGHRKGFVSWVGPDHKTIRTAQPAPYSPFLATLAPDGTIWTVGLEVGPSGFEKDPAVHFSHGVIRHFDKTLRQVGSFVPRTDVFGGKRLGFSSGYMVSNKDRVGWYARIGQEYYEVTFDGKATRFAGVAPPLETLYVNGLALTDHNEVFVAVGQFKKGSRLLRLDRSSGTWIPTDPPRDTVWTDESGMTFGPELLGGDGNRLAFRGYDSGNFEIKFFKVGAKP